MSAEARLSEKELSNRIKGAAHNIARQWNVEPDDVEQEIILGILEQYTKNPDFLGQTNAYIVNKGAWAARSALAKMATKEWNHEVEDTETEAGAPLLNLVGSDSPWSKVELEMALNAAYADLDETDQVILQGMYNGLNRREIGQSVGLSHTSVNNHIPAIAQAIRAQL